MKKDGCIFCMIANGEIPSYTVYEDERYRAVLDAGPASEGHTLIIPKNHFEDALSADDETLSTIFKTAVLVGNAVKTAVSADGINITQNNGEAAGQTVHHLHVHIIPRHTGDGNMVSWEPHEPVPEKQEETASRIRAAVNI